MVSSTHSPTLVSIVAPFYNEETSLPEFIKRLKSVTASLSSTYIFEFIIIDDGSQDNSLSVAKDLMKNEDRLRIAELRRNYGQTAAIQAGFDYAKGDIIISMDADLQHFPEDITSFLEKLDEGYDVVCGWRHERREGVDRTLPSKFANFLIRKLTRLSIHDIGTTYRAYRKPIIQDIDLMGENHRFIPVFAAKAGASITEIKIKNIGRHHGKSNYGLSRSFNVLFDLFFILFYTRFLDRPIRMFGILSLSSFLIACVIAIILTSIWLTTGAPVVRAHSGWFVLSTMLFLASLQLMLAGVLAEIVVRIYYRSGEHRPFHIRNWWTGQD